MEGIIKSKKGVSFFSFIARGMEEDQKVWLGWVGSAGFLMARKVKD